MAIQSVHNVDLNSLETFIRTTWDKMWDGDPPWVQKIEAIPETEASPRLVRVTFELWGMILDLFDSPNTDKITQRI